MQPLIACYMTASAKYYIGRYPTASGMIHAHVSSEAHYYLGVCI